MKNGSICLFTSAVLMHGMMSQVLAATATATANTGIDQELVAMVLRLGSARSLVIALQEMGRNARKVGMSGSFIVFSDWKMFVKLLLSILLPKANKSAKLTEYMGMNSVKMSKSPRGKNDPVTLPRKSELTVDESDKLLDILFNENDIFQLLATDILGLECRDGTMVSVIQRDDEGDFCTKTGSYGKESS